MKGLTKRIKPGRNDVKEEYSIRNTDCNRQECFESCLSAADQGHLNSCRPQCTLFRSSSSLGKGKSLNTCGF